ncbi:hypothetical protein [Bacillus sp. FJAT-27225]|uniref:hypothetical protein n=1 Tax=Bacillus sp. FJAT-27225 TaxID=1743144 RepID=UPI001586B5A9|nr:hypothetical protein [Bacillus sp. FJAT-27225]
MERKSFITEDTKINIDESAFKAKAEELICELFVDYVNNLHDRPVIEMKIL